MVDNVCFIIPRRDNDEIIDQLQNRWRRDTRTYSGNIQNMGVSIGLDRIIIKGSLARFLTGENVSNISHLQVKEAILKLERETGISFESAIIRSIECSVSIITTEQPTEYLKLFGYPAKYTRHEYATITGVETVTYSTPSGSYQFTGYNKAQEVQRKKKQKIPVLYEGENILRLEYKITRRRGIKAKFKRDLTAYDLFHSVVYKELQTLFIEAYQAIPKFGWQYDIAMLEKIAPKQWFYFLAKLYRQTFPKEYLYYLKVLKESGALTEKSLERIRAANRKMERKYIPANKSHLITELDGLVMEMMRTETNSNIMIPSLTLLHGE